jgi:ADP-ribose pyrophosphatase YjhB (NUDIX family)
MQPPGAVAWTTDSQVGHPIIERNVGWSPDGWKINESPTDALRREVREETGLLVVECQLFGVFSETQLLRFCARSQLFDVFHVNRERDGDHLKCVPVRVLDDPRRVVARDDLRALDLATTHRPIIDCYLSDGTPPYFD